MKRPLHILLINPWITDFAAYDLWSKPLGLLFLAALLRDGGCLVSFVDCLARADHHTDSQTDMLPGRSHRHGTGKYPKMIIDKPRPYHALPRPYFRYGIHPQSLRLKLGSIAQPDLIWVTSVMTYWYPGVQQTIAAVRQIFPASPIWLGGVYAQLCPQHAQRNSGADLVITQPAANLPRLIESETGFTLQNEAAWRSFQNYPAPALDLIPALDYAPLMTSRGCLFNCPYCASRTLAPDFERRASETIINEILMWHDRYGIADFAFYDDALLLEADTTLKTALQAICREDLQLRFHTPNALHIRALTSEWCALLKESGFTTLRLGLETTRRERHLEWGDKLILEMFFSALYDLREAGFRSHQVGVYLLCGVPGQRPAEIEEAIKVVEDAGALPYLAEYSPLPGTAMWPLACRTSVFDIQNEPLYHNNSFFACRSSEFSYQDLRRLKENAQRARLTVLSRGADS